MKQFCLIALFFGLLASISFAREEEKEEEEGPQIPAQCDLYADAHFSEFSCCIFSYQEKSSEAFLGLLSLKYIHLEFYARHDANQSLEDFLSKYFTFKNWPSYARVQDSKNIQYEESDQDLDNDGNNDPFSFGQPSSFKLSHKLIRHHSRYATHTSFFGLPMSFTIEESTDYVKRERPKPGARISYDFYPTEGAPMVGMEDKRGEIHVFDDDDEENFLFVLKFRVDSGGFAKWGPNKAEKTILLSIQDVLKGMMGIQDNCHHEHLNDLKTDKDGNILN